MGAIVGIKVGEAVGALGARVGATVGVFVSPTLDGAIVGIKVVGYEDLKYDGLGLGMCIVGQFVSTAFNGGTVGA